jgi:hypothetical protein
MVQILSGNDNVTLEMFRMLACASVLIALGLEVYAVVFGKPFDIQAYGIGLGSVLLASGGALRLKEGPAAANSLTQTTSTIVTETKP